VCEGEPSAQLQEAAAAPAAQLAALLRTAAAVFGAAPGGATDPEPLTAPWLAAALAVALRSAERCCTHIHTSPTAVLQVCIVSADWLLQGDVCSLRGCMMVKDSQSQGTEAAARAATGCRLSLFADSTHPAAAAGGALAASLLRAVHEAVPAAVLLSDQHAAPLPPSWLNSRTDER
jgi:hypothetical protein